jgi:hypothetical protein
MERVLAAAEFVRKSCHKSVTKITTNNALFLKNKIGQTAFMAITSRSGRGEGGDPTQGELPIGGENERELLGCDTMTKIEEREIIYILINNLLSPIYVTELCHDLCHRFSSVTEMVVSP